MNELKIKGRLIAVLPTVTGISKAGKDWTKKDFVIETDEGQFTKKIAFTLFGDKTNAVDSVAVGTELEVSFNIDSREVNDKWYHNINAWLVKPIAAAAAPAQYSQTPPPPPASMPDGTQDDLPF
jgi:hypothetical protein